jgi:hypothetical protein
MSTYLCGKHAIIPPCADLPISAPFSAYASASRSAFLLRDAKRVGGRVVKRTIANLSKLPDETIEALRLSQVWGVCPHKFGSLSPMAL